MLRGFARLQQVYAVLCAIVWSRAAAFHPAQPNGRRGQRLAAYVQHPCISDPISRHGSHRNYLNFGHRDPGLGAATPALDRPVATDVTPHVRVAGNVHAAWEPARSLGALDGESSW